MGVSNWRHRRYVFVKFPCSFFHLPKKWNMLAGQSRRFVNGIQIWIFFLNALITSKRGVNNLSCLCFVFGLCHSFFFAVDQVLVFRLKYHIRGENILVFSPSTVIWFLMDFQTRYRGLDLSEKLWINQGYIIQKIPILILVILQWRVQDKGNLHSRWSLVRMH